MFTWSSFCVEHAFGGRDLSKLYIQGGGREWKRTRVACEHFILYSAQKASHRGHASTETGALSSEHSVVVKLGGSRVRAIWFISYIY